MISEMFAICSSMITNCNPMTNPMIKKLFKYMTSQRFKKPMTIKKRHKLKSEKGNAQRGIPRKAGAGRNIFISPELDTHTNTHTAQELITALVFVQPESNSMVVHFNGFESEEHSKAFASKLMKKAGIDYHPTDDLFGLPTIH